MDVLNIFNAKWPICREQKAKSSAKRNKGESENAVNIMLFDAKMQN